MDCLRLFTKEDVLDGDEKPVRGRGDPWGRLGPFPSVPVVPGLWAVPSPSCLCRLPPTDVLPLQSQDEVHKKIQHPEVPQDPGAPYPSGRGMGTGTGGCCVGEADGFLQTPLCPLGSLTCSSRPETLLRGQDTKQQTHHVRQLPAEGPGPPGVRLSELQ